MIKTIKRTKRMNLPELIELVWDNGMYPSNWELDDGSNRRVVHFYDEGMFRMDCGLNIRDTFTVEVEEPISEDTAFDVLIAIDKWGGLSNYYGASVDGEKDSDSKLLYALIDGRLELIWERDDDEV